MVPVRHMAQSELAAIRQHVDDMLRDGIIRRSSSAWHSRPIIVLKTDGSTRFCINYSPLNAVTEINTSAFPSTLEVLNELGQTRVFTLVE